MQHNGIVFCSEQYVRGWVQLLNASEMCSQTFTDLSRPHYYLRRSLPSLHHRNPWEVLISLRMPHSSAGNVARNRAGALASRSTIRPCGLWTTAMSISAAVRLATTFLDPVVHRFSIARRVMTLFSVCDYRDEGGGSRYLP